MFGYALFIDAAAAACSKACIKILSIGCCAYPIANLFIHPKLAICHSPVYLGQWYIQSKRLSKFIGICACHLSHTAYAVRL